MSDELVFIKYMDTASGVSAGSNLRRFDSRFDCPYCEIALLGSARHVLFAPADFHVLPVVLEFFAAIQTHDVSAGDFRPGINRPSSGNRESRAFMRATEEKTEKLRHI
jgi:hypothetical protein